MTVAYRSGDSMGSAVNTIPEQRLANRSGDRVFEMTGLE